MSKRKKIYNKTDGKCYYCGCDLPDRWHADHFIPVRRNLNGDMRNGELDTLENKVPSCPRCNIRKATCSIETFRNEISLQVERLKRDSSQFRLALDYGLIEETGRDVLFHFEKSEDQ